MIAFPRRLADILEGFAYEDWFRYSFVCKEYRNAVDQFHRNQGKIDVCPDWTSTKELIEATTDIIRVSDVAGPVSLIEDGAIPVAAFIDFWSEEDVVSFNGTGCPTPEFHVAMFLPSIKQYAVSTLRKKHSSYGDTRDIESFALEMDLSFKKPFILLFGEETRSMMSETIILQNALDEL